MFRATPLFRSVLAGARSYKTVSALPRFSPASVSTSLPSRAFAVSRVGRAEQESEAKEGELSAEEQAQQAEWEEWQQQMEGNPEMMGLGPTEGPKREVGKVHVQLPAPYFTGTAVAEGSFHDVSLEDYAGKWLILLFYPMDWTFVCPTEILSFNNALSKFRELNTEVLAVSTDSEYSHLAWANTPRKAGGLGPDLKLPLFSDKSHQMSKDYGVHLPEGVSLRGMFIIDPEGNVRQSTINDLPIGRSVSETLRLVQALQFYEENGEVCPADWSPENPESIKPDPKGSLEYFSKGE